MAASLSATTCTSAPFEVVKVTPRFRIMAAGKCTVILKVGKLEVPCPCGQGIFTLASQSGLDECCTQCHHLLSDHQDAQIDVSLSQGLASVSSQDQGQQHVQQPKATDHQSICPRQSTVSMLATLVDSERIVHVRGTPASGKSILSRLLRDYYIEKSRNVFFMERWTSLEGFDVDGDDSWNKLVQLLQKKFPSHSPADYLASGTVIIVDEAQSSYADSCFWNTIIKQRQFNEGADIRICLFCSYGSPLTGVEQDRVFYTPAVLNPGQCVTLTPQPNKYSPQIGLFFTRVEFNDAVFRIIHYLYPEQFTFDEEAKKYLFSLTNGYPGGVSSMISYIYDVCFILHPSLKSKLGPL